MILIDRFLDSTIAYQHFGFGIKKSIIENINNFLLNNLKISFTFLNIVDRKNLLRRLKKRKNLNRYDKFDIKFYNKVQKGFLKLAKRNAGKYKIIDSNLSIVLNKELIIKKVEKLLK